MSFLVALDGRAYISDDTGRILERIRSRITGLVGLNRDSLVPSREPDSEGDLSIVALLSRFTLVGISAS